MRLVDSHLHREALDGGEFACPSCETSRSYTSFRIGMRRRVLGVSLYSVGPRHDYLACDECKVCYDVEVLDAADAETASHETACMRGLRRVLVKMTVADGAVDDREISEVVRIIREATGVEVSESELVAEVSEASFNGETNLTFLAILSTVLDKRERVLVAEAALRLAIADGRYADEERALMAEITDALGVEPENRDLLARDLDGIQAHLGPS